MKILRNGAWATNISVALIIFIYGCTYTRPPFEPLPEEVIVIERVEIGVVVE